MMFMHHQPTLHCLVYCTRRPAVYTAAGAVVIGIALAVDVDVVVGWDICAPTRLVHE